MKSPLALTLACGIAGILGSMFPLVGAADPAAGGRQAVGRPAVAPEAPYTFRARDVLGMTVKNNEGEPVGAVDDLVVDGRNGQVLYAVIAYGSVQNQEQLVIMPWTILQTQYGPNSDDRFIVLDVEPQRIQKAPVVTRSQWPQVVYSEWSTWQPKIDNYYKVEIERKQKRNKEKIKIKDKRDDD